MRDCCAANRIVAVLKPSLAERSERKEEERPPGFLSDGRLRDWRCACPTITEVLEPKMKFLELVCDGRGCGSGNTVRGRHAKAKRLHGDVGPPLVFWRDEARPFGN